MNAPRDLEPSSPSFDDDEARRLRASFATRRLDAQAPAASVAELADERIWAAASGELTALERREIIDRLAQDPAAVESWRLAVELQREAGLASPASRPSFERFVASRWLLAAAVLVAVVLAGVWTLSQRARAPEAPAVYRQAAGTAITSELDQGAALERASPVLRWSSQLEPTSWSVRVTTAELEVLVEEDGIEAPRYEIAPERLAGVAANGELFWQVEAHLEDGTTIASRTFVVSIP